MSPKFRNEHKWKEGAPWVNEVDEKLKQIASDHSSRPIDEQYVSVAPKEGGWDFAEGYIEKHPEFLRTVQRIVRGRSSVDEVPVGVLEAAARNPGDPTRAAMEVLRSAYNHGEAMGFSLASTPFMLTPQEARFVQWIGKFDPNVETEKERRSQVKLILNYTDLANQLLDLLHTLENARTVDDLPKFLASDGHDSLARWFGRICQFVAEERPETVEDKLLGELMRSLDDSQLRNTLGSWLAKPADSGVSSVGFSSGVADLFLSGPSILAAIGIACGAIPGCKGALKRLGYVAAEYDGPQWPFLYTFYKKASARRIARVKRVLRLAWERRSGR